MILLCACAHGVKSEIPLDTGSERKTQNPVGVNSDTPDCRSRLRPESALFFYTRIWNRIQTFVKAGTGVTF